MTRPGALGLPQYVLVLKNANIARKNRLPSDTRPTEAGIARDGRET